MMCRFWIDPEVGDDQLIRGTCSNKNSVHCDDYRFEDQACDEFEEKPSAKAW